MSSQALPVQAEQLFRYLFEQASLGIAVEDLDGTLLLANPALCSMLGYEENELCGMSCSQFANPEDSKDDWAHFQQLRAGIIDHYSLEKRYVRKDGVQLWGGLNVSLLKNSDGGSPLVFAFVENITERKRAETALANVSRRLIEAQEHERTRIGRELHDDIGQRLALLAVELQQLHEDLPNLPEVHPRMDVLQKQTSEIAADIQSLSHELHSAKLQYLGIPAAIKGFCQEFGEQQKTEIDFKTNDLAEPVPPDISLCLFRVLQEALHNSAKHSRSRQFEVRLWETSAEIHLTVRDFGAGFDREEVKKSQGLGLISMEERLKMLNGTLTVESQPQRGTTIHARVPLSAGVDSIGAAG
ncbi:MAG TPA: PAS domain S-box protein [Terriglobales bacterium]|jgi:PAS domain S-box-containing protein|nr:PAS domain S-box protein [Terriglobales bacterium]